MIRFHSQRWYVTTSSIRAIDRIHSSATTLFFHLTLQSMITTPLSSLSLSLSHSHSSCLLVVSYHQLTGRAIDLSRDSSTLTLTRNVSGIEREQHWSFCYTSVTQSVQGNNTNSCHRADKDAYHVISYHVSPCTFDISSFSDANSCKAPAVN